jgi:hypothetical protein
MQTMATQSPLKQHLDAKIIVGSIVDEDDKTPFQKEKIVRKD